MWAPSTKMRGSSQIISIRPGNCTLARPAAASWSSILNPRPLSVSTRLSTSPQLTAWWSPRRGTCTCSYRLIGVVKQMRVCRPEVRENSNRLLNATSSFDTRSGASTSAATRTSVSFTSGRCGTVTTGMPRFMIPAFSAAISLSVLPSCCMWS